jgi:hypothetical protein
MKVAMHRGMKKATLPLARRLAVIMHSIRARFTSHTLSQENAARNMPVDVRLWYSSRLTKSAS